MSASGQRSAEAINQLIVDAGSGARSLTDEELADVLAYVAQVGFDPAARERARGRLAGLSWQGRVLQGSDLLPPAEAHYLRHVVLAEEWPPGTSLADYLASIRGVVLEPRSGVATCRYFGAWQLTVISRSGAQAGPGGYPWVLVDYRVDTSYWVTAFQPSDGLLVLQRPERTDLRWLRQPR